MQFRSEATFKRTMNTIINSAHADTTAKTALSLIGDIRACERAFNALSVQATELGLRRNENEGDITFLGRIATQAIELKHDLLKKEAVTAAQRQAETAVQGHRRGLAGLLDRAANAASRL